MNLVLNGTFSHGNTNFSSEYRFTKEPRGLWDVKTYAVGKDPGYYHPAFRGFDHTTGHGKFMMINAATNSADVFIWSQVVYVQPNSTYHFIAWVSSLSDQYGEPAEVRFVVNGQTVGSLTALPVVNRWARFSGKWKSESNRSAILAIYEGRRGWGGGDFGLDDIALVGPAPPQGGGTPYVASRALRPKVQRSQAELEAEYERRAGSSLARQGIMKPADWIGNPEDWILTVGKYRLWLHPVTGIWHYRDRLHHTWETTPYHAGSVVFSMEGGKLKVRPAKRGVK